MVTGDDPSAPYRARDCGRDPHPAVPHCRTRIEGGRAADAWRYVEVITLTVTDRKKERHVSPRALRRSPLPHTAGRGAARRGLDRWRRMGEGRASRVSRGRGPRDHGFGDAEGGRCHTEMQGAAAARTSPLGPRWRGRRRTHIFLGDGGRGNGLTAPGPGATLQQTS
jgi:hypothetical protein